MAQVINKIVQIIPFIPPEENNSDNLSLSVSMFVSINTELIIASNLESDKLAKTSL